LIAIWEKRLPFPEFRTGASTKALWCLRPPGDSTVAKTTCKKNFSITNKTADSALSPTRSARNPAATSKKRRAPYGLGVLTAAVIDKHGWARQCNVAKTIQPALLSTKKNGTFADIAIRSWPAPSVADAKAASRHGQSPPR